jgi:pimeloyl-ACP methyl ester carboxylesterase
MTALAHAWLAGDARPLVLIHGWTCDRAAMQPVADAFPGHRRLLLDLGGHGASPKDASLTIADQAHAVLALTPPGAMLIGHSMGGQIALEAACLAPETVAAAVLLDPAPIVPHDKAKAYADAMAAQLAKVDIPSMLRAFGRQQLIRASDPAAIDALIDTMAAIDPAIARAAWEQVRSYDGASALIRLTRPTLVINIDKALNRLPDLARASKQIHTAQVMGSGHMLQFEVMDQVAAMIRRFLALALGDA